MKTKSTKKFIFSFAIALIGFFSVGIPSVWASGPMKDIELDPGKMKDIELDPGKMAFEGNMLMVFPSVVSTEARIDFYFETDGLTSIRVFDISGKEIEPVMTGNTTHGTAAESILDVTLYPDGMYFVEVSNNGVKMISKIIVSH